MCAYNTIYTQASTKKKGVHVNICDYRVYLGRLTKTGHTHKILGYEHDPDRPRSGKTSLLDSLRLGAPRLADRDTERTVGLRVEALALPDPRSAPARGA